MKPKDVARKMKSGNSNNRKNCDSLKRQLKRYVLEISLELTRRLNDATHSVAFEIKFVNSSCIPFIFVLLNFAEAVQLLLEYR